MRRYILSALSILLLLTALLTPASAMELPNLEGTGSISITMTCQGEVVPGGVFYLYHVADPIVENEVDYRFEYNKKYKNCDVPLENLDSPATAQALADYTAKKGISHKRLKIDDNGQVKAENLDVGLYLLVQKKAGKGFKVVAPFLVTVPMRRNGSYIYDVDASPKLEIERAPTTVPPTTKPSKLPHTGQNQWPVPVMAVSGLLVFTAGWYCYASGKKKDHET